MAVDTIGREITACNEYSLSVLVELLPTEADPLDEGPGGIYMGDKKCPPNETGAGQHT
jgi:hypothetical protein